MHQYSHQPYDKKTIYNQAYGYQTFKQNLQAHAYTQSNQPSNWKLYSATQTIRIILVPASQGLML